MVVQREDLQLGGSLELLADPVVSLAADLALVQVGLARVGAHDADPGDIGTQCLGPISSSKWR